MRLSELRPCDGCRGPLVTPRVERFYVVRVQTAVVNPHKASEVAALEASTRSLIIAESMADKPEDAIHLLGDMNSNCETELRLCGACFGRSTVEPLVHRVVAARRTA